MFNIYIYTYIKQIYGNYIIIYLAVLSQDQIVTLFKSVYVNVNVHARYFVALVFMTM